MATYKILYLKKSDGLNYYYVCDGSKGDYDCLGELIANPSKAVQVLPSGIDVQKCSNAGWTFSNFFCTDDQTIPTTQNPTASSTTTVVVIDGTGFDRTYSFYKAGTDFKGTTFVSAPAPSLLPVTQNKPRVTGNDFPFIPQATLNTALFKRIPKFNPHSSKILIYPGGLYNDAEDNDLIGRGWTHVSESTSWPGVYPTNLKRAIEMANYAAAKNAADSLPSGDYRKQKLYDWSTLNPAFEGNHLFIDDEETCKLYAKYWWATFKQPDWTGGGVEYFSVNHEVWVARNPDNYVMEWYNQVGWITKAIIAEALADGVTLKSGMTDWGNLSHVSPYFFDDNDSATGFPRYMSYGYIMEPYRGSSQSDPIGTNTDIARLVMDGKAFVGVGRYMQHTMDDQTMFERNPDGSMKKLNGEAVWRSDNRQTTITGQNTLIYKDDYLFAMIKRYGFEASDYANVYFRAGSVHLPLSTLRKSGYEKIRFSGQFRLDTESQSGINPSDYGLSVQDLTTLNERPLNPNWTEGNAIRMYLNEDYIRGWMETQPKTTLGADNGKGSKARASVEMYAKGFQRASNLDWIFDTAYKPIEPKLWLKNQGIVGQTQPEDQFYRKPIIRGGIGMKGGLQTIWIRGEWPCQDVDRTTQVIVWVNKNGVKSKSWRFSITGRTTFLDYWSIGNDIANVDPADVYFQFNSLLDEKITWTGDYRSAKITDHPTPPDLA